MYFQSVELQFIITLRGVSKAALIARVLRELAKLYTSEKLSNESETSKTLLVKDGSDIIVH